MATEADGCGQATIISRMNRDELWLGGLVAAEKHRARLNLQSECRLTDVSVTGELKN